jgi:hypothetical protein
VIEPEFTFLQVKIEGRRTHASETCQTGFGESPEAFDPVDMGVTGYKLVLSVVYPEVFPVSDVDQTIITAPSVGVDDALQADLSPNDRLKSVLGTVGNDLGIDLPVSLEETENDGLTERPSAPFPFDPPASLRPFLPGPLLQQLRRVDEPGRVGRTLVERRAGFDSKDFFARENCESGTHTRRDRQSASNVVSGGLYT